MTAAPTPHPAPAPAPVRAAPVRVGLVLGAVVAPTALGVSAPAVALPQLGGDLGLSGPQTAWVLAGYALTLAVGTALSGRLADLRGLRRTMLAGAALLLLGSAVAGLATGFGALLVGRLLQGGGGAAVSIAALGTIAATLPDSSRARALAALTSVVAAVSGAGSLVGGLLSDAAGWRAVLALPALAVLALPAAARLAPAAPTSRGRLDGAGAALLALVAGSAIVLLQAPSTGIDGKAAGLVALLAAAAAGALTRHVRAHPDGFLPAAVVADPLFLRYALVGMTLFAAYLAMLFTGPLLLAERQEWGPLGIGLALLPAAAAGVTAARLTGAAVARRLPDRRVAAALALTSSTGLLLAAAVPHPTATALGLAAAVSGFAGGQVVLVGAVPRLVPAAMGSAGLALFNFLFIFGGALGSAAAGGLAEALSLPTALALVALLPLAGAALAGGLRAPTGPASSAPPTRTPDGDTHPAPARPPRPAMRAVGGKRRPGAWPSPWPAPQAPCWPRRSPAAGRSPGCCPSSATHAGPGGGDGGEDQGRRGRAGDQRGLRGE